MKEFKIPIILTLIFVCVLILGTISGLTAVGSFPYAQKYKFYNSRLTIMKSIEHLKSEHSEFVVPNETGLVDQIDSFGNFHIYIYISSEKRIAHAFIGEEENNDGSSNLYFVGIEQSDSLGQWKIVNHDFPRKENIEIKRNFTMGFLDKLSLTYHDKGNGMWIFWK